MSPVILANGSLVGLWRVNGPDGDPLSKSAAMWSIQLVTARDWRDPATVRALLGRLSALSVLHSKAVSCGTFVWAREALNGPIRRFPARAVRAGRGHRTDSVVEGPRRDE